MPARSHKPAAKPEPGSSFSIPNSKFSLPSALTPKLRFPEFRDGSGWDCKRLGEVSDFSSGGTPSKNNPAFWNGTIPWISASSMYETRIRNSELNVTNEAIGNGTRIAPQGSLLILVRGSMLFNRVPIGIAAVDVAFNQDVKALSLDRSISADFLLHQLLATESRIPIDRTGIGAGKIETVALAQFEIGVPSKAEQQKIAECLSTLDELIGAESRKLDALQSHKKGLMQQLFPRAGETRPRLRFPEFQNAPEWAAQRLGKIGRVIRGSSPRPKSDPRYFGGPVPRLMVQDVTRDGKWVTPRIDSLTKEGAKLSRPCPAGTLTIVCSGDVGVVSFLAVDACIHDGFLALIDIDESIVTKDFLFHSLSTLREQFEKGATHGGVFTNLTTSIFDQFEIRCPIVPAEQNRITSCLTSLDDLIAAQSAKLEALRIHKRGLMQQLFPSPSEAVA